MNRTNVMVTLPAFWVERLVQIADRAGVKQGLDIVGPHDTVIVEQVRARVDNAEMAS